jgi:hypothetical protein
MACIAGGGIPARLVVGIPDRAGRSPFQLDIGTPAPVAGPSAGDSRFERGHVHQADQVDPDGLEAAKTDLAG